MQRVRFSATLALLLAMTLLGGCGQGGVEHDPWASADEYAQERARSPEKAEELELRLTRVQTDR